jgi:hypothetical protein
MTTSTAAPSAPDAVQTWVPVDACTLPTSDQPLWVAEFDDLFTTSLRDITATAAGLPRARLVLAGDDTLPARVQRLADAETACCSFFIFTVTDLGHEVHDGAGGTEVALDIEVPPGQRDVLDALVARAAARASE